MRLRYIDNSETTKLRVLNYKRIYKSIIIDLALFKWLIDLNTYRLKRSIKWNFNRKYWFWDLDWTYQILKFSNIGIFIVTWFLGSICNYATKSWCSYIKYIYLNKWWNLVCKNFIFKLKYINKWLIFHYKSSKGNNKSF
jgi:hypothetical protein